MKTWRCPRIGILALVWTCTTIWSSRAAMSDPQVDSYRTVKTAVRMQVREAAPAGQEGRSGYLGISAALDAHGRLWLENVAADSPAATAGFKPGDFLLKVDGKAMKSPEDVRALLQNHAPGEAVKCSVERSRKKLELTATLAAISRPMHIPEQRAIMGVRVGPPLESTGLPITGVTENRPADKGGLKQGDVLLKANEVELGEGASLNDVLAEKRPGDKVQFLVRRRNEEFTKEIELVADDSGASLLPEEQRALKPWRKPVYRLGILLVDFPDAEANPKVHPGDWEEAFLSHHSYTNQNATGQPVFGSLADYYEEQSCGKLRVEGRAFEPFKLSKKRGDYNIGPRNSSRTSFFNELFDAFVEREGKDAGTKFDGFAIIYSGERIPNLNRGSLFWPHRSSYTYKGKPVPYVIIGAGGARMASISTMCHEFGHMLGLPDQYARPENPGSEGLGTWCAMSNQSANGRPQHFCAWCKEQLGWLQPVPIDPAVKQKLVLDGVERSTNECFKVMTRADGAEYLLLENRRKQGFDKSLAADGLLIWRVVANRPILEESHGVEGSIGPRVFLGSVPFPSRANNSFTPYTTPSSRPQLGGGAPVFITNIRKLLDGRVAFEVGAEYE